MGIWDSIQREPTEGLTEALLLHSDRGYQSKYMNQASNISSASEVQGTHSPDHITDKESSLGQATINAGSAVRNRMLSKYLLWYQPGDSGYEGHLG